MKRQILAGLLMLAVLAGATVAQAGWVLVDNREGDRHVSYIQNNVYRFEDPSGQSVLFDLNQGRIYFLDEVSDCYWSGTPEDFEAELRAGYLQQVRSMLAKVPEDQRQALEEALADTQADGSMDLEESDVRVTPTTMELEIAGYRAIKHEVWAEDRLRGEIWLAPNVDAAKEIDPVMMGRFMAALTSGRAGASFMNSPRVTESFVQGWPLRIVEYSEDGQTRVLQTRKVEQKDLPEAMFQAHRNMSRVKSVVAFCPTDG